MKLRITPKKRIEARPRTLIYGEPGIGKSTFAAAAPNVVFLCLEEGANNISVQRAHVDDNGRERNPHTFDEVCQILEAIGKSPDGIDNVAIDTLDMLESFAQAHICKIGNKRNISEYNYGKGYDLALGAMRIVLSLLERLRLVNIGVIVIGHATVSKFNNTEGADFDYYDIKVHKKIAGLLVEWSDNVLFARREQSALEQDGKVRGVSSGARFIHTTKMPGYVAKNRYDLPDRLPLSWYDYEQAMQAHSPARHDELLTHVNGLLPHLDSETKDKALVALERITDTAELARFVDYVRSKIATGSVDTTNSNEKEESK